MSMIKTYYVTDFWGLDIDFNAVFNTGYSEATSSLFFTVVIYRYLVIIEVHFYEITNSEKSVAFDFILNKINRNLSSPVWLSQTVTNKVYTPFRYKTIILTLTFDHQT